MSLGTKGLELGLKSRQQRWLQFLKYLCRVLLAWVRRGGSLIRRLMWRRSLLENIRSDQRPVNFDASASVQILIPPPAQSLGWQKRAAWNAKGDGRSVGRGRTALVVPAFAAGKRADYAQRYAAEVSRIQRLLPPESTWIDSHCHLESILYRTWQGGVKPLVMENEEPLDLPGLVASWPAGLEGCICNIAFRKLSESWGEFSEWQWLDYLLPLLEPGTFLGDKIWFAIGLHPSCASMWDHEAEQKMRRLSSHPRCVGIGECGLDFSFQHVGNEAEVQLKAFRAQAALAVELGKALVVHARQAEELCYQVLSEVVPPKHPVHIHCYTESLDNARQLCANWENLMIGFTGCITFGVEGWTAKGYGKGKGKRDRPADFEKLVQGLPLSRFLIETDGPYMCPEPFRMQTAHPGHVHRVAERIAEVKQVALPEVMEVIRENCRIVYGI